MSFKCGKLDDFQRFSPSFVQILIGFPQAPGLEMHHRFFSWKCSLLTFLSAYGFQMEYPNEKS